MAGVAYQNSAKSAWGLAETSRTISSFTTSGTYRGAVVSVISDTGDASSLTWSGSGTISTIISQAVNGFYHRLYYVVDPPTGATNIVADWGVSAQVNCAMEVISVNSTVGAISVRASQFVNEPSHYHASTLNMGSSTTDLLIAFATDNGLANTMPPNPAPYGSETLRQTVDDGLYYALVGVTLPGAGVITDIGVQDYDASNDWNLLAVSLQEGVGVDTLFAQSCM